MIEFKLETNTPYEWVEKLNINNYAYRQAISCIFLEKLYSEILVYWYKDESIRRLLTYLSKVVHKRQYNDLGHIMNESFEELSKRANFLKPGEIKKSTYDFEPSFYFQKLYSFHGMELYEFENLKREDHIMNIFVNQYVAYLRGADRYSMLRNYNIDNNFKNQWENFFYDAFGNASNVLYFLLRNFNNTNVYMSIAETIKYEDRLIKSIWKHNDINVVEYVK